MRRNREDGGKVRVGRKRSLYMSKDGSMRSVGKLCLDCNTVWFDGQLIDEITQKNPEESFLSRMKNRLLG